MYDLVFLTYLTYLLYICVSLASCRIPPATTPHITSKLQFQRTIPVRTQTRRMQTGITTSDLHLHTTPDISIRPITAPSIVFPSAMNLVAAADKATPY